jgi:hypothetical protein
MLSSGKGIPLPTTNPTVLSIIENYLPTIVVTILEPVWGHIESPPVPFEAF